MAESTEIVEQRKPKDDARRHAVAMDNGLPLWKRVLDIGCIALFSPGLLIIGGLVALVIKLGSPGPILFRQERVGYRGRSFTIFKFRTMKKGAETESHRRHTQLLIRSHAAMIKLDAQSDPRLVPLGALLRACGLDELPQLLNVLRGEMSLVGPRPCIPYEFEMHLPWQRRRYDSAPGLTGLWQVSGKNRTTFEQMVWLDIHYAERRSFWLDFQILARTLPAIWRQYCDLQEARRGQSEPSPGTLGKSVESYQIGRAHV